MYPPEDPILVSGPTLWSLGQEYRIYPERIELRLHLFGSLNIPFSEVEAVELRPPIVLADILRGDYDLKQLVRCLKADLADLREHIAILKKDGFWRQIRITPQNPAQFKKTCDKLRIDLGDHL